MRPSEASSDSTCGSESTREVREVSEDSALENIEVCVETVWPACGLLALFCVVLFLVD